MPGNQNPVPRGRIRRTMPLAGFTARAAGGRMVAALREKTGDAGAVPRFHERTAERYLQLLGHSKGVLMKAGQMLSMVDAGAIGSGGFSPYQQALSRLQADAPAMDPALAKEVLRFDLGRPVTEVFAEFSDEPMAAASIGQVHHAVLPDGREVAVKIQYPGVARAIRDDLANTELLSTFVRFFASASGTAMPPDLRGWTREIAARIAEETDYRHEAANIAAFGELYRDHPFIRIPEVVSEASGDRVLTMTFLDGLDWAAAQRADQDLKNIWAEAIVRFVGGSYRHANMFNADPHPGNYRFGPDGRIGVVDFGCVKVLPESVRRGLVEILRAAIDGRRRDLHDQLADLGCFAGGSALSEDEAYQWACSWLYGVFAPQPYTCTADATHHAIRSLIDLRSPDHPARRLSVPPDLVLSTRITLTIDPICAALSATLYFRSIVDDLDGVAEPITPLGKLHDAWVRERGLPYGLDHHDHP